MNPTHRFPGLAGACLAAALTLSPALAQADNVQNAVNAINMAKQLGGLFAGKSQPQPQAQQPQPQVSPLTIEQEHTRHYVSFLTPQDWIAYTPANPRGHIYLLSDATCPFSREMHKQVPSLVAQGIEVRYVSYPRGDKSGAGWKVHRNIWCAKDRKGALERAMAGKTLPAANCSAEHLESMEKQKVVGLKSKVPATPTTYFENGGRVRGLVDTQKIVSNLQLSDAQLQGLGLR
ncbi:thioredoxin fold domain-containing protein [Geopseudomonas aromaticivorans]